MRPPPNPRSGDSIDWQVAEIVRAIVTDRCIEASKGLLDGVRSQFEAHPAMSYTACYLAEEARVTGNEPLLTFDTMLAKQHAAGDDQEVVVGGSPGVERHTVR